MSNQFFDPCVIKKAVLSTGDWLKKHAGHTVSVADQRISIKLMRFRQCENCDESHLFYMATIPENDKQPKGHGIQRHWTVDRRPCLCRWCGPYETETT